MTSAPPAPTIILRLRIQHVGFEKVGGHYPALFVSYGLDDGRAGGLFQHRYRDERTLLQRARSAAERGMELGVLEAVRQYQEGHGAPRESLAAVDKLARGAAAVVTGQQPSVGLGPLYNLYKAQAAIKYAQAIEARGIPCVAIFWNHSDDVRGGDSVCFPDRENRLRWIPLQGVEPGTPLCEAGSTEMLQMFAGELASALPETEFSPWVREFLKETHRGTIAESFTRSLLKVLGPFGLVVLEPRHLEGARAEKFFASHLADPGRLSKAVEAGRQAVLAQAFEDHLGRDVGLDLFEVRGGKRTRLEKPGPVKGRLSAGVALRPLLQDAVLPTCAYVGGPSEVGYQAALLPAYRAFGIEPPVVFPRITATLLEMKTARILEKFSLSPSDLFMAKSALEGRVTDPEEDVSSRLAALSERLLQEMEKTTQILRPSPAVDKAREKTAGKVREAFEALSARLKEEQGRQENTGRGQLEKLLTHIRPEGKVQERVFTPLYYASLYGPPLFHKLLSILDPFVFSHQFITIL